jgi:hypothetical protein
LIFCAEFSCHKPTIPVVSVVATNLLQDSNDKHLMPFDNDMSRDATNIMRHDMIHNWKQGHISAHQYFDLLYFHNPVLHCVVQTQFQLQSTSRTTFLQKGENDEDMTPMHMTMTGAWNRVEEANKGVQVEEEARD